MGYDITFYRTSLPTSATTHVEHFRGESILYDVVFRLFNPFRVPKSLPIVTSSEYVKEGFPVAKVSVNPISLEMLHF